MTGTGRETAGERKLGAMSDKRRERIRLEISREAARLFWEQGVDATTGEQIAETVGLSVRTLWRYFRNKESCAEPLLAQDAEEMVDVLRRWPRNLSLEEHLMDWLAHRSRDPEVHAYDMAVSKITVLAKKEPALRSAWLMANDRIERELVDIVAARLRRSTDDIEVRMHAAAANAVLRVINEDICDTVLSGAAPPPIDTTFERIAHAVRVATGGALGDPVES